MMKKDKDNILFFKLMICFNLLGYIWVVNLWVLENLIVVI